MSFICEQAFNNLATWVTNLTFQNFRKNFIIYIFVIDNRRGQKASKIINFVRKMSVNLKAVYAFAREYYPKNVDTNIQYGTAGFRTR